MARRIRTLSTDEDSQPIKIGAQNSFLWNKDSEDWQGLVRYYHKSPKYQSKVWAKFDSTDLCGIHLMAALWKNDADIVHGAECQFRVFSVDLSDSWTETLLFTTNGTQRSDGRFTADVTHADLGSPNDLDGEKTLAIEVSIKRFRRTYKNKVYVNHLGVFDSIVRLRQEIEYLDLTKTDL